MIRQAIALSVLVVGVGLAQQPARDAPAQPPPVAGTGRISGTVMFDEQAAKPVRRAAVTLTNPESGRALRAFTDDEGRFVFSRLPAGRYLLAAAKGAQVTANFGAPRIGLPGSAIALSDGQSFSVGTIKMTHGAVMTGTVFGAMGRPMPGTNVGAVPIQVIGGERKPTRSISPGDGVTDDRGVYRIFGLAPGTYLLTVATPGNDMATPTDAEYEFAAGRRPSPPPSSPVVVSAPVFYPGAADSAAAVPITLVAGEERAGLDIHLQLTAAVKVSGSVVGLSSQPSIAVTRLFPLSPDAFNPFGGQGNIAPAGNDGTFAIPGVTPGSYQLLALAAPLTAEGRPPDSPSLWGSADIQAAGKDITGIVIQLQPMMKMSGTVVYETASGKPPEGAQVSLRLVTTQQQLFPGGRGVVQADGTFTIEGIAPGAYRVGALLPGPGLQLKSAIVSGKDAVDAPIEIRPGNEPTGLVVRFAERLSEINGTLVDAKGQPAPQFYVHVFTADRTLWLPDSRRIKNVRASTDGKFSVTGLPAGDYYLCALTEFDPTTSSDPAFLEELIPASAKITLGDGERKTQLLRLAGGGGGA